MHSQVLNAIFNVVTQHKSYDTLPEGIKLPLDCTQELTDFDEKLKENSTFKLLVCYLYNFDVGFFECLYFLLYFIHFYIFYIFLYTIFYSKSIIKFEIYLYFSKYYFYNCNILVIKKFVHMYTKIMKLNFLSCYGESIIF